MKQLHGNGLILGATAIVFLAAQPVKAQLAQVTNVQLKPVDGGVNVVLTTSASSRPQIFTTKRGNSLVADIINSQLRLPKGNNFRQENPAPGITSVEINQLDTNSIRLIITGSNGTPSIQPVKRGTNGVTLGFMPPEGTTASTPPQTPATNPAPGQAQGTSPTSPTPIVPNPQVSIDGTTAQLAQPGRPPVPAPPFLPRAVAPPVGDIAVSNMDASPSVVDLGTQERVPRLVLRDAPVREVLSLLARAAGLNLAYAASAPSTGGQQGAASAGEGPTISIDIENEPVQDVFNYVLRLSGLEANRNGRTVFVGTNLPNASRDLIMRNLRLNQIKVDTALSFLVSLGAESAITRERLVTSVNAVPVGGAANSAVTQTQTTTELKVETLRTDFKDVVPLLRGLQASGDQRTNSLTLVGPARLIDIAIAQLTQLDIRRRQVAINVKIIDVNLLNTKDFNTSFSFGVDKNFFVNDGGAAALNFGGVNPPTSTQTTVPGSLTPPITRVPLPEDAELQPFLDSQPNAPFGKFSTGSSAPLGDPRFPDGRMPRPSFGTNDNPLQPGITEITEEGLEFALPTLFQFPKRFLASLQAQVASGNAKILTDPTLTVQEGEEAQVQLTAEVYGGIETVTANAGILRKPIIKDAGLTLAVKVDKVDDNGFVSLSVAPTVSAPNGTTPSPDGVITLLAQRSLRSGLIRLRDGQTLILSGIIQESDRVSVSKVPILGDIPLLGSLFRKTNKVNQRQEVIVLLTPQVMDDSERSSYGYNYTPSPDVRQMLERRGLQVPRR
ncbi:MAG: AMIN domain-containing protein [Chlorogloeopsis fritschii C42_A2020_084]|uniref:type IV pilus secretin family protein n=1 Tax=Chlorogloeopsis fritschii TaxID=1124 RepID=UPI0019F06AF8|nr:type IV pilus secretin family protein [Chlorogloeopsis fritschii]MBF2009336.1 AMIN domain-containing protein [Chlorogloeopsis fritschii C42_A2020_084]